MTTEAARTEAAPTEVATTGRMRDARQSLRTRDNGTVTYRDEDHSRGPREPWEQEWPRELANPAPLPRRRSRGSCSSVLATLLIVVAVIIAVVQFSPLLDFGDIRDTVLTDYQHGEPGSGGPGYTFLATTSTGAPITWACEEPIEIVVNPQGAPRGYADMVSSAVDRVSQASGFEMVITGETDDRTFADRGAGPVLVGWADEGEVPALTGYTAGVGGATYIEAGGGGRAVGGMVVLDTDVFDWRLRSAAGEAIIMHELIHVLGLGHTEHGAELMAATHRGQTELGEGDLAGLQALRQAACT